MAYKKNRKLIVPEMLNQCQWFSSLPESLRNGILTHSSLVELNQNQSLLAPGVTQPCLYCVVGGALGVSSFLKSGKEVLVTILEPISWGGELSLFDGAPRTHAVYAVKRSHVLLVHQPYLDEVLEADPGIWKYLGLLLTQKLRTALNFAETMTSSTGAARLANRLLWMSSNNGLWAEKNKRVLEVQQEDLARMSSLNRTTVNQILQKFEKLGAVELHYGKVEIKDPAILTDIALCKDQPT